MLRKPQAEMDVIIKDIISGSSIKKILCDVTPGGGKSMLPIIAGQLITAGLADCLCWVVPRKNLQEQGETNFVDPFFREMINHNLTIRSSTNELNPCRGLDGFVTTYQAIGFDNGEMVNHEFKNKRFVLVLDEFHHVEKEGIWHEALKQIVDKAAYIIYMTGTLERGDGNEIAFIDYESSDNEDGTITPCIHNTDNLAVIRYSRTDALREQAILPLKFFLSDGKASWLDRKGQKVSVDSLRKARDSRASHAVFSVLHSEFAEQLLAKALNHWQHYKKTKNRSKMLIVTADYEMAVELTGRLKEYGYNVSIATSHENLSANLSIRRFKEGSIDILVTIAMAYEGLDCPEITHICCLTNIRSGPWIEQMIARAVRVDKKAGPYKTQTAFVFAPDDIMLRRIIKAIQKEQAPFLDVKIPLLFDEEVEEETPEELSEEQAQIIPLESSIISHREVLMSGPEQLNILPKTPKITETELRKDIQRHVGLYCFKNRYDNQKINGEIKETFFKARSHMTIPELKEVLKHIKIKYPLDQIRGTGHRVSTKVLPFNI